MKGRPSPQQPMTPRRPEIEAEADGLPEGWVAASIADVTVVVPNWNPESEPDRDFGYVDIGSINNSAYSIESTKRFLGRDAPWRARRPIQADDVLFSNVRTYLRNVAIVPRQLDADLCSTGFTVLRSNGAADTRFLFRYLLTDEFIRRVTPMQTGSNYPATTDTVVKAQPIQIPPLSEQKRIVEKVEQLLEQVNAARDRLAKVPAILKAFRQSVLSAACSGRLTADWREKNPDVEGNPGPDMPDGWSWKRLDSLIREPLANGRSVQNRKGGFPVLRLTSVRRGGVDISEHKEGAWTACEAKRFVISPGDFLVARGNGSLSLVGKGGLVTSVAFPVAYPDTLIRVRPAESSLKPSYLRLAWESLWLRSQIEAAAHTTAGIHKISQKDISAFLIPLPPVREQEAIVQRAEALLALADSVEQRVADATIRAEKLTQAILAKAFRGELVPTEAELARKDGRDYEPASALLERIKKERVEKTPVRKRG